MLLKCLGFSKNKNACSFLYFISNSFFIICLILVIVKSLIHNTKCKIFFSKSYGNVFLTKLYFLFFKYLLEI